jgi:hypothetical protein
MSKKLVLLAGLALASLCACSGSQTAKTAASSVSLTPAAQSPTVAPPVTTITAPTTTAPPAPTTLTVSGRVLTTFLYGDDVRTEWPKACTGNGNVKVDIKDGAGAILYVADATNNATQISRTIDNSNGSTDLVLKCAYGYTATVPVANVYTYGIEGSKATDSAANHTVNAADIQATGQLPDIAQLLSVY